jgi:NHL repeat
MNAISWRNLFGPQMPSVPALDGAFRPNQRLDLCRMVDRTLATPDDVVVDFDGRPIVSAGNRLVRVTGRWYSPMHQIVRELEGTGGALAQDFDGSLVVAVDGRKIVGVGGRLEGVLISETGGRPLHCVTALAMLPGHRLAICEGSSRNELPEWSRDLLERGNSGRVIVVDLQSKRTILEVDGLAWPLGVTLDSSDGSLIVTECWRHRVVRFGREGDGWGGMHPVLQHLPGYPGRIVPAATGGFWLSLIAVRTQLVEYVIAHRKFCDRMIDEIQPEYWIAPSLAATDDPLEPMQLGGIKQGGVKKPWAPPRSYGLVARLDASFQVVDSLHSRHDCKRHGIMGLREHDGTLFIVSKGHGKLIVHAEDRT